MVRVKNLHHPPGGVVDDNAKIFSWRVVQPIANIAVAKAFVGMTTVNVPLVAV